MRQSTNNVSWWRDDLDNHHGDRDHGDKGDDDNNDKDEVTMRQGPTFGMRWVPCNCHLWSKRLKRLTMLRLI